VDATAVQGLVTRLGAIRVSCMDVYGCYVSLGIFPGCSESYADSNVVHSKRKRTECFLQMGNFFIGISALPPHE
jgi:hypothetical protein